MRVSHFGSSPRTRGTGRRFADVSDVAAVHPRARGEQSERFSGHFFDSGSSPRTRGTDEERAGRAPRARFIPAHAGNSPPPAHPPRGCSVHPRARGEQYLDRVVMLSRFGSSPRTRGTDATVAQRADVGRLIPAHAGNSFMRTSINPFSAVHPRARGEQSNTARFRALRDGSSPRTRGTAK